MRDYEPYYTEDGSIGLYSYADKDVYHSKFGAVTEAWEKFVIPSGIDTLINTKSDIKVLDLCYGIGYNTKALMSYVINKKIKKRKNIILKTLSHVSIHINNISRRILKKINKKLLIDSETIDCNNSIDEIVITIDCMDVNEELVKLSPFFKTIKTSGEIYECIVPKIFNCFDSYYKLKRIFENVTSVFMPHNKKEINELLELKFKNMHIDSEYKVNGFVNYILLNQMSRIYGKHYLDKNTKKSIKEKRNLRFLDKSLIKYAKFNQIFGYNLSSSNILLTFLHNIYYGSISRRYKLDDFKAAERLFNITFYVNDARKSIKLINKFYDCVFLDAFTYTKAPQLWTVEFIAEVVKRMDENGVILTYSNSAQIRNTLLENNLYVGKIFNIKTGKFNGTIASKNKSKIRYPLNNYEIGLCNTTAGIPYHDPNLSFSNKEIIELREYEFRHSSLMSSSKYMKIRSLRGNNE